MIALDDEEGRLLAAAEKTIVAGLLSAIILELHLTKNVHIENNVINVVDKSGTANRILDNVLQKLVTGKGLLDTIESLTEQFKDIQNDLNELLVQRGILKKEATKLLWIPLSERMDNANYAFEQEIRNSLRMIVIKNAKPTVAFAILMALVYDCNILDEVFQDKDELIDAVKVAKDIVNSPVLPAELSQALKALKSYFHS